MHCHLNRSESQRRKVASVLSLLPFLIALAWAASAHAEGRGNILRIDPRSSQTEGAPVLTTVVELVQNNSISKVAGPCNAMTGDPAFDCVADAMEKPKSLWEPLAWPEGKAYMTIHVEDHDEQLKLIEKKKWGDASKDKVAGVGTAWLILIDAGASIGKRFDEAKSIGASFVSSKRDNDVFKILFFNDAGIVYTLEWTTDKTKAVDFINNTVAKPFPASGRGVRELGDYIKQGAVDGFRELGNQGTVKSPMHQAMVVLSSGDGGSGSSSSVGQAAEVIKQYMTKGRFPEDNLALPKMPVPVISIWFPAGGMEERFDQARAFMQNLANTEIGGYFTIIRDGAAARAQHIVDAVRARFDAMWIIKWQASCVAPTIQQTFNLTFDPGVGIGGDGTYKDVPVGIDPKAWPLDVDVEKTVAEADKNPVYPGGKVTIFGNFCWEGHKERAELYLLPKNQEVPATLEGATLEDAKNAQRTLIEQGLKATVVDAGQDSVTFELPDKDKFLAGKPEALTARMVLYDNSTKRTSAVTKDKIITVKAQAPSFLAKLEKNKLYIIIGVAAFGGIVLILLLIAAFRSGGRKRGGAIMAAPPPRVGSSSMAMAGPSMSAAPAPMPPPPAPPPPPPGPAFVQRATLTGSQGIFTVLPGSEMKAGRDGALCQILLTEPRVSGAHASLKIDNGQLMVRDDNSNNGTTLNGSRLPPGVWTQVPNGALLRFGPIEFTVSLE